MNNLILITGGFDPIHSGHIAYIQSAKKLGDLLVVGLNSDEWLRRKKGKEFLPFSERKIILENIKDVDLVIDFDDSDDTAKNSIIKTRELYPNYKIIFANGGDRTSENIPEMDVKLNFIEFVFGIGGENKKNSSSWILKRWNENITEREWGYYKILYEDLHIKVKELVVFPLKQLSMQKHSLRKEHWHVVKGVGLVTLNYCDVPGINNVDIELKKDSIINIHEGVWHQLKNTNNEQFLHVIEIQYGKKCIEEDIIRKIND